MSAKNEQDVRLLCFAARALRYTRQLTVTDGFVWMDASGVLLKNWNPLDDDGDALRAAVELGLVVEPWGGSTSVYQHDYDVSVDEPWVNQRPLAATRRAIVRAAAMIGSGER